MLKNYIIQGLRSLLRNKVYTIINILSLAIGIISSVLIFLYAVEEFSYDKYHEDKDRIFRISLIKRTSDTERTTSLVGGTLAPTLINNYSQVESAFRLLRSGKRLIEYNDKQFYEEQVYIADKDIFNVLTIPFIAGNPKTALAKPNSIVISERIAIKYLGHDYKLGEVLEIDGNDWEVTGILMNSPTNTFFKYDLISSIESYKDREFLQKWEWSVCQTYIKLKENVSAKEFEALIKNIADKYIGEDLKSWGTSFEYFLQPIPDIHLYSDILWELETPGNKNVIIVFLTIGFFILLIACINYTSLTTANSLQRAKEIGLRKVLGASRKQLIIQFYTESFLIILFIYLMSMYIVELLIPLASQHFNISLSLDYSNNNIFIGLLTIIIITTFFSASYPALYLSSLLPVKVLKGKYQASIKSISFRKVLVIIQFSTSILLFIVAFTIQKQINYMINSDLGFSIEQKLIIPINGGININENYESIKSEFQNSSIIKGVTASSSIPGEVINNYSTKRLEVTDDKNQLMDHLIVDPDFTKYYDIELIEGRFFDKNRISDRAGPFLINEQARKALGFTSATSAIGSYINAGTINRDSIIIGVVKDFHYSGLQQTIKPLVIEWINQRYRFLTLSYDEKNRSQVIEFAKATWASLFPEHPFEYFFLDDHFVSQYNSEKLYKKLIFIFSILAIIIGCLGIFGLVSYTIKQKYKEIAIRKVNGASIWKLMYILNKSILVPVLFSNIIAWPLAWYFLSIWLRNFPYHINVSLWTFILVTFIIILISIVTIFYHTYKAANLSPAETLRYE